MAHKSDMSDLDRLVTAAVVGGVASGLSQMAMARYVSAETFPDTDTSLVGAVVRGAVVGLVISALISRRRGR